VNNVLGTSSLTQVFVPGANENAVIAIDPRTDTVIDASRRSFFTSVDYVGAVENAADDRFTGWTLLPAGAPN
jgi:hypothetical protein